jgi:hypothetical protein
MDARETPTTLFPTSDFSDQSQWTLVTFKEACQQRHLSLPRGKILLFLIHCFRIRHNSRHGICVLSSFVDLQSSTGVKIDLHSITTDISPILVYIFDDMRSEASYATLTSFGIRNIYLDDYPRLFTSATDDYPRLFTSATEPADTLGDALRIFVLRFNVPNTCRLLRHYASRAVSGGSILPPMRHNSHSNTCAHGPCYSREPTSTGLCLLLINENTFITLAMHISPANSESNINYRYGADNNA